MITRTEINKEAKQILKQLFTKVMLSDNKDDWRKAMEFIHTKANGHGREKFIWEAVRVMFAKEFGKKFIPAKIA